MMQWCNAAIVHQNHTTATKALNSTFLISYYGVEKRRSSLSSGENLKQGLLFVYGHRYGEAIRRFWAEAFSHVVYTWRMWNSVKQISVFEIISLFSIPMQSHISTLHFVEMSTEDEVTTAVAGTVKHITHGFDQNIHTLS